MATRHPTAGMAHPTVVPENFTPDASTESDDEDGEDTEPAADGDAGDWPA